MKVWLTGMRPQMTFKTLASVVKILEKLGMVAPRSTAMNSPNAAPICNGMNLAIITCLGLCQHDVIIKI